MLLISSSQAFAQSTFIIRNAQEKFTKSLTTTGTTVTRIDSFAVAANEVGLFKITVIGYDEAGVGSYIGVKRYNYTKSAGTLTIPAAALDSVETISGITGTKFRLLTTAYSNPQISITGKASTTIKWVSTTTQYLRRTD